MITAGCDVGSLTSKAVVMRGDRILGSAIIRSRTKPEETARQVLDEALKQAGLSQKDISKCVGTGYGRERIDFVNDTRSEIACHGRGAKWLVPTARTVIDIGGQDCKAMRLDENGAVGRFVTNDKCAAGTGRFLEVMADVLHVPIEELGKLSARAKAPVVLASTCTVWAQADVIEYLNAETSIEDIGGGINNAMAGRVASLANAVKVERDVCMTGGVAKNIGVIRALEKLIGQRIVIPRKADPQLAGAIGAALLAQEGS
jgi:predicted CoA-substrate-specific enzyme activase